MTLHEFNTLDRPLLIEALRKCCTSTAWINKMLPFIPAEDLVELLEDAEEQWWKCSEEDWKEAFAGHPKIGDANSLAKKFSTTADWAAKEQQGASGASDQVLNELARANKLYEEKFGYIFIVCATGKTAEEMLAILQARMENTPADEIQIAADEQNKITRIRLEKLME